MLKHRTHTKPHGCVHGHSGHEEAGGKWSNAFHLCGQVSQAGTWMLCSSVHTLLLGQTAKLSLLGLVSADGQQLCSSLELSSAPRN